MFLFLEDVLIYTNFVLEHLSVLQPLDTKLDLYFRGNLEVSELRNVSPEVSNLIVNNVGIKHPFFDLSTILNPDHKNLMNQNIVFSLTTKNPNVEPSGHLINYMAEQVGVYNDKKMRVQFHQPHYLTYEYINPSDMNTFRLDEKLYHEAAKKKRVIRSEEVLDLVASITTTPPYSSSSIQQDLAERFGDSLKVNHFQNSIVKAFELNTDLTNLDYSLKSYLKENDYENYNQTLKKTSKLLLRNLSNPEKFIGNIYK